MEEKGAGGPGGSMIGKKIRHWGREGKKANISKKTREKLREGERHEKERSPERCRRIIGKRYSKG